MDTISLFKSALGLNNVADPTRITFDPQRGVEDLSIAVNIDIDDYGRIHRRKGFASKVVLASITSMFADNLDALVVGGTTLYRLRNDFTTVVLRTDLTDGQRMSFAKPDKRIYYCNGLENGYVLDNTSYVWTAPTYVGPSTFRRFSDPPIGHLVAYWNGRIYVGQGNILWFSEPWNYGSFDLSRNFYQFNGRIRMVRGVDSGLYVSDEFAVYFLRGVDPFNFERIKANDNPAVEGTDCDIDISLVKGMKEKANGIIWTSTDAICLGTSQGNVVDLTGDRLTYPSSNRGCAVVLDGKYLVSMED